MYNFNYQEASDDNHFCFYSVLRRSIKDSADSKRWIERCRCGRFKVINCKFIDEVTNSPKIIVNWFDSEGKPNKKTGRKVV